ncbi:hypothetical protein ACSU6B_01550 [Neobacillus sp. C211]|uniref:hypothetical protein n=1 Tax=unclassified Neobacillus TaxID=2675272 RepID=UPI00397CA0BB
MISEMTNTRPPDVVAILWEVVTNNGITTRRIVEAEVVGTANPCQRRLVPGRRLSRARECLVANGFDRVFQERFGDFGVSIFVRF